jgi:hypothetical protein
VQLTLWDNYSKYGRLLGIPLAQVNHLDMALQPDISLFVTIHGMKNGWFRKDHTLDRYINSNGVDFIRARNIINSDVGKNGRLYSSYAEEWQGYYHRRGNDSSTTV